MTWATGSSGAYEYISGWTIGEDGKCKPKPCDVCNGRRVTSRPANQSNPIECGYERWVTPCWRCGFGPGLTDILIPEAQ